MNIEDRFTRGFIAGACAEVIRWAIGWVMHTVGLEELRYLDFASVMIYGHKPLGIWESLFAEIAVIGWTGILGIIFAYLIPVITNNNRRFKGALYGIAIWFASYAATLLYKIPELMSVDLATAVVNGALAVLWGVLLAEGLKILDARIGN